MPRPRGRQSDGGIRRRLPHLPLQVRPCRPPDRLQAGLPKGRPTSTKSSSGSGSCSLALLAGVATSTAMAVRRTAFAGEPLCQQPRDPDRHRKSRGPPDARAGSAPPRGHRTALSKAHTCGDRLRQSAQLRRQPVPFGSNGAHSRQARPPRPQSRWLLTVARGPLRSPLAGAASPRPPRASPDRTGASRRTWQVVCHPSTWRRWTRSTLGHVGQGGLRAGEIAVRSGARPPT